MPDIPVIQGGLRIRGLAGMATITVLAVHGAGCEHDIVGMMLDQNLAYRAAAELVEAVAEPDDIGAAEIAKRLYARASATPEDEPTGEPV